MTDAKQTSFSNYSHLISTVSSSVINDFFPFTFKSNVFQKVGERKRMNKGDEEERGQRCKSEKKRKRREEREEKNFSV